MRERLDCAILEFGDMAGWCKQQEGIYAKGRLHLHRLWQPDTTVDDIHVLAGMASQLQRFDACLLAVCEENLAWIRQALLVAHSQLRTPVIGLVRNLKAPAIDDLYNLGMADFVRKPLCAEELRIRIERLLDSSRIIPGAAYAARVVTRRCAVQDKRKNYGSNSSNAETVFDDDRGVVTVPERGHQAGEIALEAFAVAAASQCATSSDSFGVAKGRVVQCFERAYLHASLARSSGNIAMAARGAKKHRRAYWALMRKHNIDAAPYRKVMPPNR